MKTRMEFVLMLALVFMFVGANLMMAEQAQSRDAAPLHRLQGPCDIYAAAGDPCVAAHSTTRALYAAYNGPLYQVLRQSDGKTLDIGVVQAAASPFPDAGGYADAAQQDKFCAGTYCWISIIYDQSPKHNDLTQAPRGGFSGPALGGFNNLPIADMAPITIMGHKVYGVLIEPGMGLRQNDVKGTAVDYQAEGQYWVVNGKHFNAGCCFDYGNAEIDSRDDDNGAMETLYFGNATPWYSGAGDGRLCLKGSSENQPSETPLISDVLLIIDTSGSMTGDKILQAKNGATDFSKSATQQGYATGLAVFADRAAMVCDPTVQSTEFARKVAAIRVGIVGGSTNLAAGLDLAGKFKTLAAVVVVTDGQPNSCEDALRSASVLKQKGKD